MNGNNSQGPIIRFEQHRRIGRGEHLSDQEARRGGASRFSRVRVMPTPHARALSSSLTTNTDGSDLASSAGRDGVHPAGAFPLAGDNNLARAYRPCRRHPTRCRNPLAGNATAQPRPPAAARPASRSRSSPCRRCGARSRRILRQAAPTRTTMRRRPLARGGIGPCARRYAPPPADGSTRSCCTPGASVIRI